MLDTFKTGVVISDFQLSSGPEKGMLIKITKNIIMFAYK